jgi:hypothetical protein
MTSTLRDGTVVQLIYYDGEFPERNGGVIIIAWFQQKNKDKLIDGFDIRIQRVHIVDYNHDRYTLVRYSEHELLLTFPSVDDSFLQDDESWNESLKVNGCHCEQAQNVTDVARAAIEREPLRHNTKILIRFAERYNLSSEYFMDEDSEDDAYDAYCMPQTVHYDWVKTDMSGAVVTDGDGLPELEIKSTTYHDLLWKVAMTDGKLLEKKKKPKQNKAMLRLSKQMQSMQTK